MKDNDDGIDVSVIVPVFNEEESILHMYRSLKSSLSEMNSVHEMIFVNDGSTDKTSMILKSIRDKDPYVRILKFNSNKGQSHAMAYGFSEAKGSRIISLDADLQNDPKDIPGLLMELDSGYDAVCGWRHDRKDSVFIKKVPSKIFNLILKVLFGLDIHDSSCTLRAYRSEAIKTLNMFDGAHRLIPIMLLKKGFKITEKKVNHNPRVFGKAKYDSPMRFFKGFRDVLKIRFRG